MSTEDVEEVVMETKEKTIEPVEEVQKPMYFHPITIFHIDQ